MIANRGPKQAQRRVFRSKTCRSTRDPGFGRMPALPGGLPAPSAATFDPPGAPPSSTSSGRASRFAGCWAVRFIFPAVATASAGCFWVRVPEFVGVFRGWSVSGFLRAAGIVRKPTRGRLVTHSETSPSVSSGNAPEIGLCSRGNPLPGAPPAPTFTDFARWWRQFR